MQYEGMSAEEYVRAKWVAVNWGACNSASTKLGVGVYVDLDWKYFLEESQELAWQAAADFTVERLEQIGLVEEEIEVLEDDVEDTRNHVAESIEIYKRILTREQSVLADLKRSTKGDSHE